MTYTAAVKSLLADAREAGFVVNSEKIGGDIKRVHIFKLRGSRVSEGVMVYVTETGGFYEAHRTDVPLSIALNVPTIKQVREILSL